MEVVKATTNLDPGLDIVFVIKSVYYLIFQPKSPNILTELCRIYLAFFKIYAMLKNQKVVILISRKMKNK
jgi:hypothetical protein